MVKNKQTEQNEEKDSESDLQLAMKVLKGQTALFSELVQRHERQIRGLCHSMLGCADLADDAAQEVFIKAFKSLASYRGDSLFSTWLYRIGINHCKDVLRSRKRRKIFSLNQLLEEKGDGVEIIMAVAPTQGSQDPDNSKAIQQSISELSSGYQEVIILRELRGLSYEEIAKVLNCSLDSVKAKLRRARNELRIKLRHLLGEPNVKEVDPTCLEDSKHEV